MKTTTKYYLIIFLGFGFFFAICNLIIDLIFLDEIKISKLIFMSTFFGMMTMFITKTFIEKKLKEYKIKKVTWEDLKVKQKRNIHSGLNLPELIEFLKSDPVFSKMKMQETHNGLVLKSRVTMESWGEVIEILQLSEKDTDNEYLVASRPRWKTVIIDYMRNFIFLFRLENLMKPKETTP